MTDDSSQVYSEIDEKLFFTSTFLGIPHNLSIIKQSEIPFTINILPENYNEDKDSIPISEDDIIRCSSCKSYINPYVEIIPPGLKWKCNLCFNINELSLPISSNRRSSNNDTSGFSLIQNAINNFNTYNRIELRSTVYELHAPSNYSIRTPSSTILCFLIEASYESLKYGMFKIVLKSILENLENNSFELRAKMIFIFYNSQVMVLSKGSNVREVWW
ncbi:Protein transport protein SEC24 [Nosema bombycis CQ1]|uniref:Protein transport protein SEC24 n=1 Tax=Nosema bombycis (strain CQ1 / CVCC 102059) TaxID=578461 RepID=R0MKT8_NOSB1|nr:Protein transport protein SEC24 [Nosema bombycis CQ1]|eukprot:EOB13378.1 Protein transport protein SEC24 [Nosema bombycis CQ1]